MKKKDTEIPFLTLLHQFKDAIHTLPTCESIFWLDLLRFAVQEEDTPWTRSLLTQAIHFTGELRQVLLYKDINSLSPTLLRPAKQSFNALIVMAKTHTFGVIGIQFFLNGLGGFLAVLMGCVGAILGAFAGLIRGLWYRSPLKHMGLGMVTLGALFGMAGYRAPKKYLKDPLFRRVKWTLDGLETTFQTIVNQQFPAFDHYREQAKNHLIQDYFNNKEIVFEEFLEKKVKYSIKTQTAEFFDPSMKGFLGNHGYICVEINDKLLGIELTPYPTDLRIPATQSEQREALGAAILEMYTFHLALAPTRNALDPYYLLTEYKAGEKDCFFQIDQELAIGKQEPRNEAMRFFNEGPKGTLARMVTENLSPWPPVLAFK